MSFLRCILFTALLANSYDGKLALFQGYPQEEKKINVNGQLSLELFEGDLLVEPEVKKIALSGGDVSMATRGRKRGATITSIWPNAVIPYQIHQSLAQYKDKIENAMREWENGTCLSFVPFDGSQHVYLRIIGQFSGCFAHIGFHTFPPSSDSYGLPLNLGQSCMNHSIILHELGHAIGFWHEQSRGDRDDYVTIIEENIKPGRKNEFKNYSSIIDSLGVPYDLKSVMHYGPKVWSKNGKDTIVPKNKDETLEENKKVSVLDKVQVNKLYNCVV